MVTTTLQPRQAAILKSYMFLTVVCLVGCQTNPPQPSPPASGPRTFLGPQISRGTSDEASRPLPVRVSNPKPRRAETRGTQIDLPAQIGTWRITRLSAREWRVAPIRPGRVTAPSLMEDAIITSSIHSRLQSTAELRSIPWEYRANAGQVYLSAPELSPTVAVTALQGVIGINKVSQILLVTTLRQ